MMFGHLSGGLLCATLVAACSADDGGPCGRLGPKAVAVDVREAVTNRSLAAGASGLAQTAIDTYSLSLGRSALFPDSVLVGGLTNGIYEVRVQRPGYQPWVQTNVDVQVTGYPCPELVTQALTAELQVAN
jgi:hypothetical protein